MKKLVMMLLVATMAGMTPVHAADKELSPQQQKMKDCNADAKSKELKGDERKAFMKECLSGDKAEFKAAEGKKAPAAK